MAKAILSVDGASYTFEYGVNVRGTINTNLANNSVLGSNKPDVVPKSATETVKLERALLMSQGLLKDQTAALDKLRGFSLAMKPVKLAYNGIVVKRAFISSLSYEVLAFRGSAMGQVYVDIDLTIAAPARSGAVEQSKAKLPSATTSPIQTGQPVGKATEPTGTKKRTRREAQEIIKKVIVLFKSPSVVRRYGLPKPPEIYGLNDKDEVLITTNGKERNIGKYTNLKL